MPTVVGRFHTLGALVVGGTLLTCAAMVLAAEQQPGETGAPAAGADAGTDEPQGTGKPGEPGPPGEGPDAGAAPAGEESGEPGEGTDPPDGGAAETADPGAGAPTAAATATTAGAGADEDETLDGDDESKAQAAAREAHERDEPRPPLPPEVELGDAPEWERRLEIGGDFAIIVRPFASGLKPSEITYLPAPAWGVHLHWAIFRWLRVHPYFFDAHHDLDIPAGALTQGTGPDWIHPGATLSEVVAETFVFGAKLAPTLELTDRLRAWFSAGVGWGRFNISSMTVVEDGALENSGGTYEVRERSGVFVEFPFGLGISFDVVPRWLAVEYEFSAAPVVGQSGNAHETFQAVDEAGETRDIGAFGAIEASFVNALGLSLIL